MTFICFLNKSANLILILATFYICCFIGLSHSGTYPFWKHDQCSVKGLNISHLVGHWRLFYHNSDSLANKSIVCSFNQVNNKTLNIVIHEDDKLVDNYNLTQNEYIDGKLDRLISQSTYTIAIPTYVFSFEPDQYIATYNVRLDNPDYWAIYGRNDGTKLSETNYNKAKQSLDCINQ